LENPYEKKRKKLQKSISKHNAVKTKNKNQCCYHKIKRYFSGGKILGLFGFQAWKQMETKKS
jgi:hypothetical protein